MSTYMKFIFGATSIMLLALGWHFGTVFGFWGMAPQTPIEFFVRLAVIVVGFIIISTVSAIMVASKDEDAIEPDEREKTIVLKAERNGGFMASIGLCALMWLVFKPLSPMDIANIALAALSLAELTKIASGAIYLRQGA